MYNERLLKKQPHFKVRVFYYVYHYLYFYFSFIYFFQKFLLNLMNTWLEDLKTVQFFGLCTKPNLQEDVLPLFDSIIHLNVPTMSERFELIANHLSKQKQESQLEKAPKNLVELYRSTVKLNCGMTKVKLDRKTRRQHLNKHKK